MVVSMTPEQAASISYILGFVLKPNRVWLHGELESIYLEVENPKGESLFKRRIWENGQVDELPLD